MPARGTLQGARGGKGGLKAYQSPDGIHWSLIQDKAVITDGAFDSQNLAFWDAARGEYRAYWRYFNRSGGHRASAPPPRATFSAGKTRRT